MNENQPNDKPAPALALAPKPDHHRLIHRIIEVSVVSLISFVGFEALITITNLYQPKIFIELSGYIYLLLLIWMHLVFDLHFHEPGTGRSLLSQLKDRCRHFMVFRNFRHFQNYLILPGTIYWGTIILIGINFGHKPLQQILAVCSSIAMICSYTFFRMIFAREITEENQSRFLILTYVKVYSAWVLYAGALGVTWYYCLPLHVYALAIFTVTFLLIYQALFQFHALTLKTIVIIIGISLLMSAIAIGVYYYWNVNYFTAGLFLTAIYNFQWTLLFHNVRKTLTKAIWIEQITFLLLFMVLILGVTNFKERIDRCS